MTAKRVLVVANQTAGSDELRASVRDRISRGDAEFTLLVPATPPRGTLVWTHSQSSEAARTRMDEAVASLRAAGAHVEGRIGDMRPLDAIEDEMRAGRYDEIIISTLQPGASRWLKQDLPQKVSRRFGLPVSHVAAGRWVVVASLAS